MTIQDPSPVADRTPRYKAWLLRNLREIPQLARLSERQRREIEVVAHVLPFKSNRFVTDWLVDWDAAPDDPMFLLNFPQRGMLRPEHFAEMEALLDRGADPATVKAAADRMRLALNPHPAGQLEHNVPTLRGERLHGMQHKYQETLLFFPSHGQSCHATCTFCFRWPQFVGIAALRFASREVAHLVGYLREHAEITDVLFTGGDPMVMPARALATYLEPLIAARIPSLRTIRIGTRALTFWPFRFLDDPDSDELLALLRRVAGSGLHLAVMAHLNHWRELEPQPVRDAIARLRETGAVIRTQSPLLRHINDDPDVWARLWSRQVELGCVPYYMFVARDTGAGSYFSVPLVRAWRIFRDAYSRVSGLCRTVRGPSMSANPGKAQVLGVSVVAGEPVLALRFLQARNPDWVGRPFYAALDEDAAWLTDLRPAFGERRFFFEDELGRYYRENIATSTAGDFE